MGAEAEARATATQRRWSGEKKSSCEVTFRSERPTRQNQARKTVMMMMLRQLVIFTVKPHSSHTSSGTPALEHHLISR
jgi:hypothetical protein